MPFDMVGFAEAAPGANGKIAAGAGDDLYRISGDDLYIKNEKTFLLGVYLVMQSTGNRIKLQQPSLPLDLDFIKAAIHTDPPDAEGANAWTHCFGRPHQLVGGEKLNVEAVNASDEDTIVGLLLGSSPIPRSLLDQVRPTHRISGYGDTTVTANTWSSVALTWNQTLPKGSYAVVGMRASAWLTGSLTEEASICRLNIPGNTNHRPGVPMLYAGADHEEYQYAGYEPWVDWPLMPEVVFEHDNPPNIEVLSQQAWTDENVELLLQKVG